MDSLATDPIVESDAESDLSSVAGNDEWVDPLPDVSTEELEEQVRSTQVFCAVRV